MVRQLEDVDTLQLAEQGGVLSLHAAAARARVTVATVRSWARRGQVFAFRWDGQTWVGEKSLYDCEKLRRLTPQGRPRSTDLTATTSALDDTASPGA